MIFKGNVKEFHLIITRKCHKHFRVIIRSPYVILHLPLPVTLYNNAGIQSIKYFNIMFCENTYVYSRLRIHIRTDLQQVFRQISRIECKYHKNTCIFFIE